MQTAGVWTIAKDQLRPSEASLVVLAQAQDGRGWCKPRRRLPNPQRNAVARGPMVQRWAQAWVTPSPPAFKRVIASPRYGQFVGFPFWPSFFFFVGSKMDHLSIKSTKVLICEVHESGTNVATG